MTAAITKDDRSLSAEEAASWPFVLQRLVPLIGRAKTLDLADRVGGLDSVHIPHKPNTSHFWRKVLSDDEWKRVVATFGGERIDLPRGARIDVKKWRILDLAKEHIAHRQIALTVGCSERYVRDVLHDLPKPKDTRQLDMFATSKAK